MSPLDHPASRLYRAETFVPEVHVEPARGERVREFARLLGLRPLGTIHIFRQADHHSACLQFIGKVHDMLRIRSLIAPVIDLDGAGKRTGGVADRHSDSAVSHIETKSPEGVAGPTRA